MNDTKHPASAWHLYESQLGLFLMHHGYVVANLGLHGTPQQMHQKLAAHDELVAALSELLVATEIACEDYGPEDHPTQARERARAALAKVQPQAVTA